MKQATFQNTVGRIAIYITLSLIVILGCNKDDNPSPPVSEDVTTAPADVAHDWYKLQTRILLERNSALPGQNFAYMGIGLYESVRNGISGSTSFSTVLNQMPTMPAPEANQRYFWQESANAAMAAMMKSFFLGLTAANLVSIDSLENVYNTKLKTATDTSGFYRAQLYGKSIAKAMSDWLLTDNYDATNTGYIPPVGNGLWIPTPPGFVSPPVLPRVSSSRTFVAVNTTVAGPTFPITYSETAGSDFYKEAKNVYDVFVALTQDQKNTALYWVDNGNGVGYTTAGHEMLIVMQALQQKGSKLGESVEAYAKAGIAERDAIIVAFRTKYQNNLIRPVSYIQKVIQPGWLPYIVTPPHPEYPAAHAVVTGAVMQAVAKVIGETTPVTDRAYEFRTWPARTYTTLFAAGQEAGLSRLYGGIHYQVSITAGLTLATTVGNNVGNLNVTP